MQDVETLFDLYKDDVYRLALSYTKSVQEAEDICQTVFMKAMEQKRISPGKERAWLMQVTANQCRSLLRSGWWQRTKPLEDCGEAAPEQNGEMMDALMRLDPKYRVVLYLHYYECRTTVEIGRLLRISQSAVTTRLSRGRELLRKQIEEANV